MSEHWPPEWEDPDAGELDGDELGTEDLGSEDLGTGQQLAAVTAALASVPLPALPASFEARISAAIAAESATRTEHTGATGVSATARSLSPEDCLPAAAGSGTATAPARRRPRLPGASRAGERPGSSRAPGQAASRPARRGRRRFVSVRAISSAAVCLVLAGFGYLVFLNGSPSGSTYSSALSAPSSAASAAAPANAAAAGSASAAAGPQRATSEQGSTGVRAGFVVRETGTSYEAATLARQVRAAVSATGGATSPGAVPSASASAVTGLPSAFSSGGSLPSAALAGCVRSLTGGVAPSLVDQASYAGKRAYIIVVPGRAWVVGLGCTAARHELIATTALADLSGNLCALGSV